MSFLPCTGRQAGSKNRIKSSWLPAKKNCLNLGLASNEIVQAWLPNEKSPVWSSCVRSMGITSGRTFTGASSFLMCLRWGWLIFPGLLPLASFGHLGAAVGKATGPWEALKLSSCWRNIFNNWLEARALVCSAELAGYATCLSSSSSCSW